MRYARITTRVILAVTFLFAISVISSSWLLSEQNTEGNWATTAAALAVVASVIAAWTGQNALELQQDAQQPYPYPTVDTTSRYGLLQLCVKNAGATPAHDIRIKWDEPLLDSQGEPVVFTEQVEAPDIPVLLPGEGVSILIDGVTRFFPNIDDANYSGLVEFKDTSGSSKKHKFYLSIEAHRGSLYYEQEEPKTHYRLQEIPKKLDKVANELQKLRRDDFSDS